MQFIHILDAAGSTAQTGGFFGQWGMFLILGVVFVAFYFFAIRPQKKQEKEAADMRNSLTIGDEITTIGGIIGRVVKVTEETVVIETSKDRTKMHILKTAIRSVDVHAADTIETAEKAEKAEKSETNKSSKEKKNKGKDAPAPEAEVEAAAENMENTEDTEGADNSK